MYMADMKSFGRRVCVHCSTLKILPRRANTIHYIYPYDTHMDLKSKLKTKNKKIKQARKQTNKNARQINK